MSHDVRESFTVIKVVTFNTNTSLNKPLSQHHSYKMSDPKNPRLRELADPLVKSILKKPVLPVEVAQDSKEYHKITNHSSRLMHENPIKVRSKKTRPESELKNSRGKLNPAAQDFKKKFSECVNCISPNKIGGEITPVVLMNSFKQPDTKGGSTLSAVDISNHLKEQKDNDMMLNSYLALIKAYIQLEDCRKYEKIR